MKRTRVTLPVDFFSTEHIRRASRIFGLASNVLAGTPNAGNATKSPETANVSYGVWNVTGLINCLLKNTGFLVLFNGTINDK